MPAILPLNIMGASKPDERFMDERGGLKRVAGARAAQAARRLAPQLAVKDGGDRAVGLLVAGVPGAQKLSYFAASVRCHPYILVPAQHGCVRDNAYPKPPSGMRAASGRDVRT